MHGETVKNIYNSFTTSNPHQILLRWLNREQKMGEICGMGRQHYNAYYRHSMRGSRSNLSDSEQELLVVPRENC
jgi:hypothetical protein